MPVYLQGRGGAADPRMEHIENVQILTDYSTSITGFNYRAGTRLDRLHRFYCTRLDGKPRFFLLHTLLNLPLTVDYTSHHLPVTDVTDLHPACENTRLM